MSDGNFNRALLPHTPYQSGVKMGEAMMRKRAVEALRACLVSWEPQASVEEIEEKLNTFLGKLSR